MQLPGEEQVDRHLDALVRACCTNGAFSRWALLTICTDRFRLAMANGAIDHGLTWSTRFHGALRYGFKEIARVGAVGSLTDSPYLTNAQGFAYSDLLNELINYDQVAHLYASAHAGGVAMESFGSEIVCTFEPDTSAFEAFEVFDNRAPTLTGHLYYIHFLAADPAGYLRLPDGASLEATILQRSVREGRYRIRYQLDPAIFRDIYAHCLGETCLIPSEWRCGGLTGDDLLQFHTALQALSYYHAVATMGAGVLLGTEGGGVNQAVQLVRRDEAVSLISNATGMPAETVERLADIHTYDERLGWADPVLMPLIPVPGNRLLLDPGTILLSNWERNSLKLLARRAQRDFDASSSRFEASMLEWLEGKLRDVGLCVRTQVVIADEEIDLLACAPSGAELLVVEAKWEIRPSDPMEIRRSEQVAFAKHTQLKRKVAALTSNLPAAYGLLGRDSCDAPIVLPLVVTDGGVGLGRHLTEFPVVPMGAVEHALQQSSGLDAVYAVLDLAEWLPKEGAAYERRENTIEFGGLTFRYHGWRHNWKWLNEYDGWRRVPHHRLVKAP
jgi:hypothetical protein